MWSYVTFQIFDKIEEIANPLYGPNTALYRNYYCTERIESIEGKPANDDDYTYTSYYWDTINAFEMSGTLVLTDLDLETRPCRKFWNHFPEPALAQRDFAGNESMFYSLLAMA
ncbi:hypothetical protein PoB_001650800 [Plakobranchus ocellatus]|uniref:Uncharacterized protein n=1 Tax=Plakobranchus ocellatus TaxID=259542 RepID=A0AAV3Z5L9_9GAST|nr:hypothetical protein PoB_001650800 [Plakobranchus ocellatus]